ncbi:MAG: DNA polymerase elongation subunit (family B) [Maribacter sp.]|jgi:DNA polymerase elongation subunit (family B)
MLDQIDLSNILFFDIETVSGHKDYDSMPETLQKLWAQKARAVLKIYDRPLEEEEVISAYDSAGIYAEFGQIVCISVGFLSKNENGLGIRVKSYANRDEKILLEDFAKLLDQYYNNPNKHYICGHNIKEFDIPYTCRRMLIHGLKLPRLLDIYGKKPWDLNYFLDTMILWKFGDYKAYTKLSLLTYIFGIPTPKDDIDGSEVGRVFWEDDDLERIAVYCEKDVVATAQLLLKYKRMELPENMVVERVE